MKASDIKLLEAGLAALGYIRPEDVKDGGYYGDFLRGIGGELDTAATDHIKSFVNDPRFTRFTQDIGRIGMQRTVNGPDGRPLSYFDDTKPSEQNLQNVLTAVRGALTTSPEHREYAKALAERLTSDDPTTPRLNPIERMRLQTYLQAQGIYSPPMIAGHAELPVTIDATSTNGQVSEATRGAARRFLESLDATNLDDGNPNLSQEQTKLLESGLKLLGYDVDSIDGTQDDKTRAAITKFAQDNPDLDLEGGFNEKTLRAIQDRLRTSEAARNRLAEIARTAGDADPSNNPTMMEIMMLQGATNLLGEYSPVTGRMTEGTLFSFDKAALAVFGAGAVPLSSRFNAASAPNLLGQQVQYNPEVLAQKFIEYVRSDNYPRDVNLSDEAAATIQQLVQQYESITVDQSRIERMQEIQRAQSQAGHPDRPPEFHAASVTQASTLAITVQAWQFNETHPNATAMVDHNGQPVKNMLGEQAYTTLTQEQACEMIKRGLDANPPPQFDADGNLTNAADLEPAALQRIQTSQMNNTILDYRLHENGLRSYPVQDRQEAIKLAGSAGVITPDPTPAAPAVEMSPIHATHFDPPALATALIAAGGDDHKLTIEEAIKTAHAIRGTENYELTDADRQRLEQLDIDPARVLDVRDVNQLRTIMENIEGYERGKSSVLQFDRGRITAIGQASHLANAPAPAAATPVDLNSLATDAYQAIVKLHLETTGDTSVDHQNIVRRANEINRLAADGATPDPDKIKTINQELANASAYIERLATTNPTLAAELADEKAKIDELRDQTITAGEQAGLNPQELRAVTGSEPSTEEPRRANAGAVYIPDASYP